MRIEELPPFLRVEQAQELTQLGRTELYHQTKLWRTTGGREGIPVVRFGRALRIPTAALLRLALIEPAASKSVDGDSVDTDTADDH